MQNGQILLHTEQTLVNAIHRLTSKASVCRVAVAYCGEAVHQFFPEKPSARPEDLRIMVDASEQAVRCGLTNPKGLERLLGLTDELRSLPGLHAKVWVFDRDKALVGSTNMSESSITQQHQLTLEVSDSRIAKQLVAWFDNTLWNRASRVDHAMVRKLISLWPGHERSTTVRGTRAKLPLWRSKAPHPPLGPSDFKIRVSRAKIKKLLSDFRNKNNKCPYAEDKSCWEEAEDAEKKHKRLSETLRSLMHRRSSWKKSDLDELFDLAYYYGQAAQFNRPAFVCQSPSKVARSLAYLLNGGGDPYVRFEKVLASGGRYKLNGMNKAGLTFLMHLWSPGEFAMVMKPLDKAFKKLQVSFSRTASRREGQGYKDQTAAIRQIGKLTGLKSLVQADRFLDAVAKAHIEL